METKAVTMENPFSLSFGREPALFLGRDAEYQEIVEAFSSTIPVSQTFMITGVRGSGKTALLSRLHHHFGALSNWMVLNLNPERNLLFQARTLLAQELKMSEVSGFEISTPVGGVGLTGKDRPEDEEILVRNLLRRAADKSRKVLFCIDEVTNNKTVKEFSAAFQIMIREELPVYMLMTGLYDNIENLQNEKSLTFLYRAPKLRLEPLSIAAVSFEYQKVFGTANSAAKRLAELTCGYPYAFQLLGYLYWKSLNGGQENYMEEYKVKLAENSYEKIWSECSRNDKSILRAMADSDEVEVKVQDIRDSLKMTSNTFTTYRVRLMRKGLIKATSHGYIAFALPMFSEFVTAFAE